MKRTKILALSPTDVETIQDARKRINFYKRLYSSYAQVVTELEFYPNGYTTLEDEIEEQNAKRLRRTTIQTTKRNGRVALSEMTKYTREQLEESTGDILFVSDSHVTLYSQVEALYAMGHRNMGLIIFDKHTDYYLTTKDIEKMQNRGASDTAGSVRIDKATFLAPLIDSGHLQAVSIAGVTNKAENSSSTYAPTHEFQVQHSDKIHVTELSPFVRSHYVDKGLLQQLIEQQVAFLRKAGVKHIILSLDIDVLRSAKMGYTSMEYSPLGFLASLALVDLSKLQDGVPIGIRGYVESMRTILNIFDNPKKVRHLLPATVSKEDIINMEAMEKRAVVEAGMPFSVIARSIRHIKTLCKAFGDIEFGVTLENGNRYFGDITELSGRDYKRRLARLLYTYMQRILRISNEGFCRIILCRFS